MTHSGKSSSICRIIAAVLSSASARSLYTVHVASSCKSMDLSLEMVVESGSSDGFLGNASGFNDDSLEEGLVGAELINCVVRNVFVMRHVVLRERELLL